MCCCGSPCDRLLHGDVFSLLPEQELQLTEQELQLNQRVASRMLRSYGSCLAGFFFTAGPCKACKCTGNDLYRFSPDL